MSNKGYPYHSNPEEGGLSVTYKSKNISNGGCVEKNRFSRFFNGMKYSL